MRSARIVSVGIYTCSLVFPSWISIATFVPVYSVNDSLHKPPY